MKNMGRLPYRRALRKVYEQRKGLAKTSRPLLNNLKHVSTYTHSLKYFYAFLTFKFDREPLAYPYFFFKIRGLYNQGLIYTSI